MVIVVLTLDEVNADRSVVALIIIFIIEVNMLKLKLPWEPVRQLHCTIICGLRVSAWKPSAQKLKSVILESALPLAHSGAADESLCKRPESTF